MAELDAAGAGDDSDPADIEAAAEALLDAEPQAMPDPGKASVDSVAATVDPWVDGAGVAAPLQVTSSGAGLELVSSNSASSSSERPQAFGLMLARLRELMSFDNFSGALELAESLLREDPQQPEAGRISLLCRERLETMYLAKLGDLAAKPAVWVPPGEVIWLDLDHRSGFVLAQVDGASSFEEIIELAGMGRLETLRILCALLEQSVIGVGAKPV